MARLAALPRAATRAAAAAKRPPIPPPPPAPDTYTTSPLTWARAAKVVGERDFQSFAPPQGGRSQQMQADYDGWRLHGALAGYVSISDFIKIERLGLASAEEADGRLGCAEPEPFPRKVIWWPNDFPYFVEPGIEHHVIWVSGFAGAPLETHPEIAAELERQRPAGSWEVLFWENPTELRSIPEVRHVQVLSRPRSAAPRL